MEYRPEHRETPPDGQTVELRVHGVGGATPEQLLDVPLTERVAGDPAAGFFRPWIEREPRPDGVVLEGYTWGGLTSASRLRALWVLLSPFALANLAGWMVRHRGRADDPRPRRRDALESVALALIRVFGVVLTVAFVGYVTVGTVDLISFQCGARPTCAGGRWWLSPWENQLVGGRPGRAIAVGALAAAALTLGTAWLARRSQQVIHDSKPDFKGTSDPAFRLNLHHRELWDAPHVAHRLGLTHTAAALAAVGITTASVLKEVGLVDGGTLSVAGWTLLALTGVVSLRLERVPSQVHLFLAVVAFLHLAAAVAIAWAASTTADIPGGPAPGGRVVPGVLLPLYPFLALLVALVVLALWRRQRETAVRVALVAPAVLLLSSGMVNAFGSGMLIRLADLLGTPVAESQYPLDVSVPQPPIVYADPVADAAVMTVVTVVILIITAGIVWFRAGRGPECRVLASRYADRGGLDCEDEDDVAWARRVARAEVVASLTDQGALVVGIVTVVVVVITAASVLLSGDPAGLGLGAWADAVAAPASVVLGITPLAAVFVISRLYRSPALRRTVGILWDVATFWPRWFHPWSPPAYGEAAVPQLRNRLAVLTEKGRVVLSAHSQGSILAVATAALADDELVGSTAFLTHGSPLTRLYARYFPEYCSVPLYSAISGRMAGWINLWRPTDYIGGPIGAPGVEDRQVFDPPSTEAPSPGERRPRPARHSDYDRTEDYDLALAELV